MATAKIEMKEIPTVKLEKRVTLELSLGEAATLSLILGNIRGSADSTARKYVDSIIRALRSQSLDTFAYHTGVFSNELPNHMADESLQQVERFVKDNS